MTDEEKSLEAKKSAFFEKVPDPPANAAESDVAAEGDAPAPKEPSSKPSGEGTASTSETPASPGPKPNSSSDVVDRVVAALKAGDLDALADLTEQDPAMFDEKTTKWAARNRRETKLKAEVAQVRADAQAIVDHYAPVDEKVEAYQKTKDPRVAADLFELLTGEKLADVAARVPTPASPTPAARRASEKALVEALRDDLPADHQVRALPEWESAVVAVLRESAEENDGEPELSFRQAAARVVRREKDRYAKMSKVFGEAPTARTTPAAAPERAAGTTPTTKRKVTRDEFFATFDAQK